MGIVNAFNNRPVRTLGFLAATHSFIYGVGYILGVGGFTGTVLYVTLLDSVTRKTFGVALIITGVLLAFAYSRNNPKTIRFASFFQSTVWLFASLAYISNGAFMLALGISLPWAFLSSYLAFSFANRVNILAYDQTPEARMDTANENIANEAHEIYKSTI